LSRRVKRRAANEKLGADMPGDPRECRKNASRCAELAHSARTPELKQTLLELSQSWLKLAVEIERNHTILDIDDPPPLVPRKRST
jgi:hypothetical protein